MWAGAGGATRQLHSIRVLSHCQSLINTLSGGPARQSDSVCKSIWLHLSTMSKDFNIFVQWIPSHIGLPRNTSADTEAKRGSTLSQSSVPIDLASAKAQIRRTGQQEFHTRYLADPHSATHRTLTGEVSPQFHWRLGFGPATYTESGDNSLHCVHTAEATTRQHSIYS